MRFAFLLLAFALAEVRGGLLQIGDLIKSVISPSADVKEQSALLRVDDYVGYAATLGMNLTMYDVETSDGWILQLWNVRSLEIYNESLSAPVIVSHGFGSSSFDYLLNLRHQSTASVLADHGYNVFLTNYRANQYSNRFRRDGKIGKPEPKDYFQAAWQFSADRDLPAIIDKVLEISGQDKLYLFGHSMGTTIPFAFFSGNHSYDDKLLHFGAVVPVLKFGNDTSLDLQALFIVVPPLIQLLNTELPLVFPLVLKPVLRLLFGVQLVASDGDAATRFQSSLRLTVCFLVPPLCGLVPALLFNRELYTGITSDSHLNQSRAAIYFSKTPGGIALMNAYDYAQEYDNSIQFRPWAKIDFDKLPFTDLNNTELYDSTTPPKYDFNATSIPYSLYYVDNDIFTGIKTAHYVAEHLSPTKVKFIEGNKLNHVDSVIGFDTRCYTTNDFLLTLEELENQRGDDRREYRKDVNEFVDTLPGEHFCDEVKN